MHIPVLQPEVVKYLSPKPNENYVDCTAGEGGHTLAIAEYTKPKGKVLAIDWDEQSLKNLSQKAKGQEGRIILVHGNFANLKEIVEREKFHPVHGILFDLGFSTFHIEESKRGFSFLRNEPLDMRYDQGNPLFASKILNFWSKKDIERILKEYGEEKFAKQISEAIVQERQKKPIERTTQLVEIIQNSTPKWYQRSRIHCATRTFQALRIATNTELENISKALAQAKDILEEGGRVAVISFHSLEDRITKNFFKETPGLTPLTKKPVVPSFNEQKENPRSRSAKLRVAQKISVPTEL